MPINAGVPFLREGGEIGAVGDDVAGSSGPKLYRARRAAPPAAAGVARVAAAYRNWHLIFLSTKASCCGGEKGCAACHVAGYGLGALAAEGNQCHRGNIVLFFAGIFRYEMTMTSDEIASTYCINPSVKSATPGEAREVA